MMAACCGKTQRQERNAEHEAAHELRTTDSPVNTVPLQRVHAILDRAAEHVPPTRKKDSSRVSNEAKDDSHTEMRTSAQIQQALRLTADMWGREHLDWPEGRSVNHGHIEALQPATKPSEMTAKRIPGKESSAATQLQMPEQRQVYVHLKEKSVREWLQKLQAETEPPSEEQMAVLRSVIARCSQESMELRQQAPRTCSEPLRACCLGIPGAGKSKVIKWITRFFTEVLEWKHGVHFQCLASQNTMAALIGGSTVHTWGCIPINAAAANDKKTSKNAAGDLDILFLRCQNLRWLLFDELSTLSPVLLGLLDSYTRRACLRHSHAQRQDRSKRPFGGFNVFAFGDLWQLPPVCSLALFSNPYNDVDDFGAQKILSMFWQKKQDSFQKCFVLDQEMRCQDPWLSADLRQSRHGCLSWEM